MISPDDYPAPDLQQTRDELREGLEVSRKLVRESRVLIELTESDGPLATNDNEGGSAK